VGFSAGRTRPAGPNLLSAGSLNRVAQGGMALASRTSGCNGYRRALSTTRAVNEPTDHPRRRFHL
jgi:hypothetical protein